MDSWTHVSSCMHLARIQLAETDSPVSVRLTSGESDLLREPMFFLFFCFSMIDIVGFLNTSKKWLGVTGIVRPTQWNKLTGFIKRSDKIVS
jgi:hypothetical protein